MISRYPLYLKIIIYFFTFVFLTFVLLPFVEMFFVSLRPLDHLFSSPYQFWSERFSFQSYLQMWSTVPMLGRYMLNSLYIGGFVTVLVLLLCIPAAYAFARLQFAGSRQILASMLLVNMFSGAVLLIPLYRQLKALGLLNTYAAMIIPGTAFLIPTSVFLLKPYIERIPKELEEAAWIDGASPFYTIWKVIVPLAAPGIAVVAAYTFISAYANQFIFAVTFNNRTEIMPIPQGLFQFAGRQQVIWNELMAASILSVLPVLLLFVVLQRQIMSGLTAGAVKE